MIPGPKTFGTKLLLLFVLVVAGAQAATWLIISTNHNRQAHALIDRELQQAGAAFAHVVKERNDALNGTTSSAVRDYAFKQLFAGDIDIPTLRSAFPNFQISTK